MLTFDPRFSLLSMAPAALANRSLCVYGLLIVFSTLYLTVLAARRLFFHSLSRFPGPRLASLTSLYKSYHEVFRGGKWLHHVDELHKLHGAPISSPPGAPLSNILPFTGGVVRVGPNEVPTALKPIPLKLLPET
jgi:hypothetical protein